MKTTQVLLLLSLLVFSSCTNRQFYKTYSAKVDSLSNSLEASASSFETIDTTLIVSQYAFIRQTLDSIKLFPDVTLDTNVIQFRYLQKKYKTILRDHPLTIKELNYTRQQLSSLKHDLNKRNHEVETAEEYYKSEEEAVVYIKKRMDAYQVLIAESMGKFKILQPGMVMLLDSLSNTKQN